MISEEDKGALKNAITELSDELGPTLRRAAAVNGHLPVVLTLLRAAAHHAIHDAATRDDFTKLCDMAWAASEATHRESCDA